MPKILEVINKSQVLKNKLFQINFRANSKNNILVTLIYHLKVNELLIKTIKEVSKKSDDSDKEDSKKPKASKVKKKT